MFVSLSLGDTALKGIFEEASGLDDVLLVFRGPKPGQKLSVLFADLKRLLKDVDPVPNIVIDPTRFQKWAVSSVPAMVVESDDKALLQVKGVSSLTWLNDKFKAGAGGDLGDWAMSTTLPKSICSTNQTSDGCDRLAEKAATSHRPFLDQQKFEVLPVALEDRE